MVYHTKKFLGSSQVTIYVNAYLIKKSHKKLTAGLAVQNK